MLLTKRLTARVYDLIGRRREAEGLILEIAAIKLRKQFDRYKGKVLSRQLGVKPLTANLVSTRGIIGWSGRNDLEFLPEKVAAANKISEANYNWTNSYSRTAAYIAGLPIFKQLQADAEKVGIAMAFSFVAESGSERILSPGSITATISKMRPRLELVA